MRAIIFLFTALLLIIMFVDIYTTIKESSKQVEKMEKTGDLLGALTPPPGEEETYKMIMAGVNPYSPEAKMIYQKKVGQTNKKLHPKPSIKKSGLLSKTKEYFVKDNSLYVTELIYNPSQKEFNGKIKLQCTLKDAEKKPVETAVWYGNVKIPPQKAVKLKNVAMGKLSYGVYTAKYISCNIEEIH